MASLKKRNADNMQKLINRRNFIKRSSMGGVAMLSIPSIISMAFEGVNTSKIKLKRNDTILFQGDSITDMRRNRRIEEPNKPYGLGTGYVFSASSKLLFDHPGYGLKIYNRGISGNKVFQLADRWKEDCLNIKPDILSILVGVNDFWHTLSIQYKGTIKTYAKDYRELLARTKDNLPDVKLIVGEPYALKGVNVVNDQWFPAFNEYRAAAKEVAQSFDAIFIPYQKIYDEALQLAPAPYWSKDGVHPTAAGAYLMAKAWLKAVKE